MSNKEKKDVSEASVDSSKKNKKSGNLKKLKFGSMSVIVIVLVIAIVIVVNLMCGLLMQRYPIKIDLTADNRYELSEQSIEAMQNLDKDVEITVMMTKDSFDSLSTTYENRYYQYYGVIVEVPFEIIPEILDKYSVYAEQGSGSVSVKYVDMTKDPDVVSRFSNYYNGEITEGSIVLQCGERVKVIDTNSVVSMITPSRDSTMSNMNMVFAGESIITTAIQSVTDSNPVRTAFVTTLNGNSVFDNTHASIAASFENFLSTNGYECSEIDISTDELSTDDYDMIVIACPSVDFSQDITSKISDFLYNDGKYEKNVIYIPSFYATNLPNISELLAEWKIEIEQSAIMDDNMVQAAYYSIKSTDYAPMLEIADSESVGTLPNNALPIIASYAKPINILNKNNNIITTEILKTSETSYAVSLDSGEADTEKASYNVVVNSRREVGDQLDVYASNLLVISSPFMFDSYILENSNTYNNASALINIVNSISGKEESVIISDKSLQQSTLALTTTSARVIQIIVIIVIPLIIAVIGVAVLLWRKNK